MSQKNAVTDWMTAPFHSIRMMRLEGNSVKRRFRLGTDTTDNLSEGDGVHFTGREQS